VYKGTIFWEEILHPFLVGPLPWRWRLQAHTKRWCIYCHIFRAV